MATRLFDRGFSSDSDALGFIARILESSTECALIGTDLEGEIQLWNDGASHLYGYTSEQAVGALTDLFHVGTDIEQGVPRRLMEQARTFGKWEGEVEHRQQDGTRFTAHVVATLLMDAQGQPVGFLFITRSEVPDVDETRRDLEVRTEQQAAIASLGALALETEDIDTVMDEAVRSTAAVLGVPYTAIAQGDPVTRRFSIRAAYGWPPSTISATKLGYDRTSQSGFAFMTQAPVVSEDMATENRFDVHATLVDAGIRSSIAVPIPGPREPFGTLVVHSVERRTFSVNDVNFCQSMAHIVAESVLRSRTEDMMRGADRLDTLGRMAGGVAHDFRNILAVVKGYVGLAIKKSEDEKIRTYLDEALSACMRANGLTDQLLTFARTNDRETVRFDAVELIEGMGSLIRQATDSSVVVDLRVPTHPVEIDGDPTMIEQILLNLAVNARDAMPDGGTLSIEVDSVSLHEGVVLDPKAGKVAPGAYMRLTVRDTGIGMSEEVRKRAFEPFFTTKEKNVGTGLGLATVYGAIVQLGGQVEIESEIGKGTVFDVLIPAVGEPADAASVTTAWPPVGRILVVDDNEQLRNLICEILTLNRYETVASGTANEAIEALSMGYEPDVALVDLVLPGTSGWRVVEEVVASSPNSGVVLMSGYAVAGLEHRASGAPVVFLHKPFDDDQLLGAIARARAAAHEERHIATP